MVLIREINVPNEGLVYSANNVQLNIGSVTIGMGTLYISQNCLEWMPNDRPEGLSVQWQNISVHGIPTTTVKCIYLMIDHKFVWEGVYGDGQISNGGDDGYDDNVDDEGSDEESETEGMTELWLVPEDTNTVDTIYQAMTDCQALNPDEEQSAYESGSDHMEFLGDDDDDDGNVGENMQDLNINDERFADAEE